MNIADIDFGILKEIGTFLGGFGSIFKGLFDVIDTALTWAGVK